MTWLIVTIEPSFISALMTSAAFTDILWARSATVIVSGTKISRTSGPACSGDVAIASPVSSSRPWRPPFAPRQPLAAAPPLVSPRSRSARRRAASSWNTCPGTFLAGLSRRSPGFAAGRCSVPSGLATAAGFARQPRRGLRGFRRLRLGRDARGRFLGFAFLLRLALGGVCLLLLQVLLLAGDQFLRLALFRLARGDFLGGQQRRRGAAFGASSTTGAAAAGSLLLAAHEHALLAHLDLDRARLAGRIGRLDFRRRLRVSVMRFLPSPPAPCCLRR